MPSSALMSSFLRLGSRGSVDADASRGKDDSVVPLGLAPVGELGAPPVEVPPIPSKRHSGIKVASSLIRSLILSLLRRSTALWLSRLRLLFSLANKACLSCGFRVDVVSVAVVGCDAEVEFV